MINIDINWSKAPEGATHVALTGGSDNHHVWYKIGDGCYQFCYSDEISLGWIQASGSPGHGPLIARPVEWDGQGLPPLGTVCEHQVFGCEGWTKATVLAYGKKKTFYRDEQGHEWSRLSDEIKFRPIRTPEQIAKEEEDQAIHQMGLDAGFSGEVQDFARHLYRAGYRKQVAP